MMRILDLFCGIGGAADGYRRAGFTSIVGVDIKWQPRFPVCLDRFQFVQTDAIEYLRDHGHEFDAIHASPPCQAHSALRHLHPEKSYECFIERTRDLLQPLDVPWVIENVMGAPLRSPVMLCGSAFGLRVRRHRIFESNIPLRGTACDHAAQGHPIDVCGGGGVRRTRKPNDHGGRLYAPDNVAHARQIMEMPWANRYGISQAIPPAFSLFIGKQLIEYIEKRKN
jgi:DNA (cytosine-5)-methyltransferase 1